MRLPPAAGDRRRDALDLLEIARRAEDERAGLGQPQRDRFADAARGAGDEGGTCR